MTVKQAVYNSLLNYGAINEKWRVEIIDINTISYSDWAEVTVKTYRPKSKKADFMWVLKMNTVRQITDYEHSTFCKLK